MISDVEQRSRLFLSAVTIASIGMIFIGSFGIYAEEAPEGILAEQEVSKYLSENPAPLVEDPLPKERLPVTFVSFAFAIFMFCTGLLGGIGVLQSFSLAIKAIEHFTPLSKWMRDAMLIVPFTAFMMWWTARILEPFGVF